MYMHYYLRHDTALSMIYCAAGKPLPLSCTAGLPVGQKNQKNQKNGVRTRKTRKRPEKWTRARNFAKICTKFNAIWEFLTSFLSLILNFFTIYIV